MEAEIFWDAQLDRIQDKLFRLAKRLLVSREEAQDATQEILLKLWARKRDWNSVQNMEALAMTMTKNYCLDQLKSKRASQVSMTDFKIIRADEKSHAIESADRLKWVEKIVNGLPENQKLVFHLRDIEGYSFEEISKMIALDEGHIRTLLSRARKKIREELEKIDNYGI